MVFYRGVLYKVSKISLNENNNTTNRLLTICPPKAYEIRLFGERFVTRTPISQFELTGNDAGMNA